VDFLECITTQDTFIQLVIVSQFIFFIAGIFFKFLEKEKQVWGFRLFYLVMPAFFMAYYSQEFLFKDWSNK